MFAKDEVKRNLLACFEIFLFMPRGIERFEADQGRMIRSFIIPLAMMPFILVIVVGLFPEFPALLIASLTIIRTVLAAALFFGAVYFMAKQMDRQEHFYRFLIVSNWTNINGIIFALPILVGLSLGMDSSAFEVYAVFSEIVGYIYAAFILTYCFRVPWEMGGFLAVVGLAINQNLWEISDYLRDSTLL
jgi:hypothetical protein